MAADSGLRAGPPPTIDIGQTDLWWLTEGDVGSGSPDRLVGNHG